MSHQTSVNSRSKIIVKPLNSPAISPSPSGQKKFLFDMKQTGTDFKHKTNTRLRSPNTEMDRNNILEKNDNDNAKGFQPYFPPLRSTAAQSRSTSLFSISQPSSPYGGFRTVQQSVNSLTSSILSPGKKPKNFDSTQQYEYESEFYRTQNFIPNVSLRGIQMRTKSDGFLDVEDPSILNIDQKILSVCSPKTNSFMDKVTLLNELDSRKVRNNGSSNRSEVIKNNASLLEYLKSMRTTDKERLKSLQVEDQDFIKKVESMFHEGSKKLTMDPTQKEKELEFSIGVWNQIQIERLQFVYCFFYAKGRQSPAKIQIKSSEITRVKTFVSTTLNRPTSMNCEYQFESKVFKLFEKNKNSHIFQNACFFFAFSANTSGTLSIKIEFSEGAEADPELKLKPAMIKREPKKRLSLDMEYLSSANFISEINQIKKEKKQKLLRASAGKNVIEENKKSVGQFLPDYQIQKREYIKMRDEEYMQAALRRKEIISKTTIQTKALKAMKFDFIRAAKDYVADKEQKERRKAFIINTWMGNMFLVNMCASIKMLHKKQLEINAKKLRVYKAFSLLMAKARRNLRKKGDSIQGHLIFDIRMSLQTFALAAKRIQTPKIEKTLLSFLEDAKKVHFLYNRFLHLFNNIRKVQKAWKQYLKKKQNFKGVLLDVWQKNYMRLYDDLFKNSSNGLDSAHNQNNNGGKKYTPQDLMNEEFAQQRFFLKCFGLLLDRYRRSYDIYWTEYMKINRDEKKQKTMIRKFMNDGNELKKLRAKKKKLTKTAGDHQGHENQNEANKDQGAENKELIVPRYFVLPMPEELDKLIREVIVSQKAAKSL